MNPFTYVAATDPDDAIQAVATGPQTKFLGGGTNLIDLMKMGVENPTQLVDINKLQFGKIEELPNNGGVRLGALVSNTDVADHQLIKQRFPVLSQALLAGASQQLRNSATVGGNLMQRTRCYYFYDPTFPACNKRVPGTGCGAIDGYNRIHAILGASDKCVAVHPSDMCVALVALDGVVRVRGSNGERTIAMNDFHRLPGDTPQVDTNLGKDEMITAIDLPNSPFAKRSLYLKLRDRASYAFALVSVAVAMDLDAGTKYIRAVRVALGGVAHKPWRSAEAEKVLTGASASPTVFQAAADAALQQAKPLKYNAFKVELAKRAIVRALTDTVGLQIS